MTMAWVAGGTAVLGFAGGIMGSNAAEKAARQQAEAIRYAADQQRQMFDIQNKQWAPYRGVGYQGLNMLGSFLPGTYNVYDAEGKVTGQKEGSGYLTQQFGPEQFKAGLDPSYEFLKQQGLGAISSRSGVTGGGSNRDMNRVKFAEDYANTAYANAFDRFQAQQTNLYNRLTGIANIGTGAQTQVTNAAMNTASNLGQLSVAEGAARAGGTIGAANAMQSGLSSLASAGQMYGMYKTPTPNTINGVNAMPSTGVNQWAGNMYSPRTYTGNLG